VQNRVEPTFIGLSSVNKVWEILLGLKVVVSLLIGICVKAFLEREPLIRLPFLLENGVWSSWERLELLWLKSFGFFLLLHTELDSLLDSTNSLAAIFFLVTLQFLDVRQSG
jgi:hypothetical protein